MTPDDGDPVLTGYAALGAWQALDTAQAEMVAPAQERADE